MTNIEHFIKGKVQLTDEGFNILVDSENRNGWHTGPGFGVMFKQMTGPEIHAAHMEHCSEVLQSMAVDTLKTMPLFARSNIRHNHDGLEVGSLVRFIPIVNITRYSATKWEVYLTKDGCKWTAKSRKGAIELAKKELGFDEFVMGQFTSIHNKII